MNARQQFSHGERLGHVVVSAQIESGDLIFFLAARREHDDRYLAPLADLPDDFDPVLITNCCYPTHLMAIRRELLRSIDAYADDRAIVAAAEVGGLSEFVNRHPNGFDMVMMPLEFRERGSGRHQRQRPAQRPRAIAPVDCPSLLFP